MSKTIDERVVEMQFDNKQFERNVQTSLGTIDRLKNSLDFSDSSKGLKNIESASKNINLAGLGNAVDAVKIKFSALGVMAVTALQDITHSVYNTGTQMLKSLTIEPVKQGFDEYELKMGSVQTIMASTGESLETVMGYLNELNTYADKTIYSFSDMTSSIGKFTNAGVKLDDAVKAIQGISNEAAVSGANAQQASHAMYNFAQALSAGYVKLIDWKSIETANMATVEFKNELIKTALALGTIKKVGDQYITTTTDMNGKVSGLFDSTRNFNESLSAQWMTTEVLVQTLGKYADETTDIGKKAFAAAQDVKTFSQLMDTLKEAVGSGWATTWETIFGDFNEAKKLWTDVSNAVGGFIDTQSDARNALLTGGLSTGWKQLMAEGIKDTEKFKETVMSVAKDHKIAIDDMIESAGSFEDTLKDGWLTSELLSESISKYTEKLTGMSEAEAVAAGYTSEQVEEAIALEKAIKDGTLSIDEFAKKIAKPSGRENLIESIKNACKGLISVITPIKEAFLDIFPPATAEQLYAITEKLKEFTSRLTLTENASANLKRTFKGVFAVADILKQAFSALYKNLVPLTSRLDDLGGGILNTTGNFGDLLVSLNDFIRKNDIFNNALQNTVTFVKDAVAAIKRFGEAIEENIREKLNSPVFDKIAKSAKNFLDLIKENIQIPGLELFHSLLVRIQERMSMVGEAAGNMKSVTSTAIEGMGLALANSNFLQFLQKLWEVVKTISGGIAKALGTLISTLANKIGNINFSGVMDFINALSVGGIALGINKFLKSVSESVNGVSNSINGIVGIKNNVVGVLNGVKGCLESFQERLKSDVLIKIATAIGILAGSILVISLIDSDKLNEALRAITTMFAELMGSMAIFSETTKGMKSASTGVKTMIAIAASVLILAVALKSLSSLETDQLATGLIGVTTLIAAMVAAAKIMGSGSSTIIKGAGSMVIFAASIKVLASACQDLSTLSWGELAKGLIGVGVLMAEVSVFLNKTEFSGKAISTATGIVILAAAMKILASACQDLGQMKLGELGKGLIAVGLLMAEISIFLNKTEFSGKAIGTATGIVILAAAIKILASAASDFATMNWDELQKGLIGVGGMLLLLAAFIKATGESKNLIATGVALVAIGAAMKIFASAIQDMSNMTLGELVIGLIGMAGALGAVTLAVKAMPKNMVGVGAGLIIVSAALAIIAEVLGKMGGMSWDEIQKGLITFGGSIAFLVMGLNSMSGTLAGSAAMLVAAAALAVLTPVLVVLGSMSWESIAKGLVTIAGAFAVIGVAGAVLTPLVPTILALSGAFALIGVGVVAIGAGLLAAGAGLSALAVGFTALATAGAAGATAIVASLTVIITGMYSLIPVVLAGVGNGIIALCKVLGDGAPAIVDACIAIVLAAIKAIVETVPAVVEGVFVLLSSVLTTLVEYMPTIVQAAFDILLACLKGIADNISLVVQTGIDIVLNFIGGIAKKIPDVIQAGFDLLINFINGITSAIEKNTPILVEAMKNLFLALLDAAITILTGGIETFKEAGEKIINSGLVKGITNMIKDVKNAVTDLIDRAKKAITDKVKEWAEAGKNLINGFIDGIKNMATSVVDAAKGVASSAIDGAKNLLGIHSPSKVFYGIGEYSGEGFVNALNDYGDKSFEAGSEMAESAKSGLAKAISKIRDIIDGDIDTQPTIRPILDLSNVETGSRRLNALFSRNQAISIGTRMDTASGIENQNGDSVRSGGNTYTFTQNNYSPKSLSSTDIYRQTKNQFTAMERMLEA